MAHTEADQENVGRGDADASQSWDEADKSTTARKEQQVFESRGFQILMAVLFTILVLTLCASILCLAFKGDGGAATSVIVTLFGVLITGIFVFMTLRVESGAKKEAQAVAQGEAQYQADLAARAVAAPEARRVAERVGRQAEAEAKSAAEAAARQVAEHEFDRIRDLIANRPRRHD